MMEDERDFEALWRIALAENEDLRKKLGGSWLRFRLELPEMPSRYDVLHFIEKHYLFCLFMLFLVSTCVSGCYTLYRDRRQP